MLICKHPKHPSFGLHLLAFPESYRPPAQFGTKVQPSALHWCFGRRHLNSVDPPQIFVQEISVHGAQTCGWHDHPVPMMIFTCSFNFCMSCTVYVYYARLIFSTHLSQKQFQANNPQLYHTPDLFLQGCKALPSLWPWLEFVGFFIFQKKTKQEKSQQSEA